MGGLATIESINKIKELYHKINSNGGKTNFIIEVAKRLKLQPGNVKNNILGGFWVINEERATIILKMLQKL